MMKSWKGELRKMGGRGSSGGTTKGFSVGRVRPTELDMPALSGSPRQVQYAKDILNRGYDNLGQAARAEESIIVQLGKKATQDNSANQRAQAYRVAQNRYAEQIKSLKQMGTMQASQIINQRIGLEKIARNLAADEFRKRNLPLISMSRNI